jgi:hypothetical protein
VGKWFQEAEEKTEKDRAHLHPLGVPLREETGPPVRTFDQPLLDNDKQKNESEIVEVAFRQVQGDPQFSVRSRAAVTYYIPF